METGQAESSWRIYRLHFKATLLTPPMNCTCFAVCLHSVNWQLIFNLAFFSGLPVANAMPCPGADQILGHCVKNCDSVLSLHNEPSEVQMSVRAW